MSQGDVHAAARLWVNERQSLFHLFGTPQKCGCLWVGSKWIEARRVRIKREESIVLLDRLRESSDGRRSLVEGEVDQADTAE